MRRCAVVFLAACLSNASAQEKAKKKGKPESAADHYSQWISKDVTYIIAPEERSVFLKLQTDEERDQFIEQFWRRRDPDPTTSANEYKEEHYRRIQYANDVFAAGIPGWMSDRGRIYIKYGAPDRIETHPAGGPYHRPTHEGGGSTSTYPFERWEYRHLEGIGDDIEIEFVDYSGGNLYKIAKSPLDKDEFLHVPWAGMTDAELDPMGRDPAQMRWMRIAGIRDAGTADAIGIRGEMAKYTPFARAELLAGLNKPPVIHFKDLQAAVTTRVSFNSVPFVAHAFFLRLASGAALAPLTLEIPNSAVTFEADGDARVSRLQVYARVSGLTGSTVFEFDDEVATRLTAAQLEARKNSTSVYSRLMRLPPGRFKLAVILKDAASSRMGVLEQGITVPGFPDGKLAASPVILASELVPVSEEDLRKDPYAFGRFRVRPRLDATFHKGEYLGVYFEVYNAAIDASRDRPALRVEYQIQPKGQPAAPFRDVSRSAVAERDLVAVPLFVDVSSLGPGAHSVVFRVTDLATSAVAESRAQFQVAP